MANDMINEIANRMSDLQQSTATSRYSRFFWAQPMPRSDAVARILISRYIGY